MENVMPIYRMRNKGKKKRNSRDSIASGGEGEEPKADTGGAHKKKSTATIGCDIFSEAAMENAYYVCHNVQDVLKTRGFAWPDGQKKKKKGKR